MQIIRRFVLGAAALGISLAVAGAVHAQDTVVSDGAGNTVVIGSGGTVVKDSAGNVVRTPSYQTTPRSVRRVARPPIKTNRQSRPAKIYAHSKGNRAVIKKGTIRGHQTNGQYGTVTQHSITGRAATGEKGSVTY